MKMFTKNQNGFALVEGLVLLVLMAFVGFIGYRVYESRSSSPQTNPTTPSIHKESRQKYEITTTVPRDWKQYNDPNTKLSFSYPSDYKFTNFTVDKKDGEQNVYSNNATKNQVYSLSTSVASQMSAAQIDVFDQPMQQSVDQLKKYLNDQSTGDSNTIKNISTTDITFNGKNAVIVKYETGSDTVKQIFVEANGYTYALPEIHTDETTYKQNGTTANVVLTITESVEID